MPRQCRVCYSPHKAEYEDLRLNKQLKLVEIQKYALNKHSENISLGSLSRHFRFDVESIISARLESDKVRNMKIKEEIKKDIKIAIALRENLEILGDQLNKVKYLDDPRTREETRDIISKINETLQLLLKFSDKIKIEEGVSEDEIYDRMLYAIKSLPADLIVEFKKRWLEYPEKKKTGEA